MSNEEDDDSLQFNFLEEDIVKLMILRAQQIIADPDTNAQDARIIKSSLNSIFLIRQSIENLAEHVAVHVLSSIVYDLLDTGFKIGMASKENIEISRKKAASLNGHASGAKRKAKAEAWKKPAKEAAEVIRTKNPTLSQAHIADRIIESWKVDGVTAPSRPSLIAHIRELENSGLLQKRR